MPFIPIRTDLFPYVRSVTYAQAPLEWHFGPLYTVRLTSRLLRVSKFNLQWYNTKEHMPEMKHWNTMSCYETTDALCEVREDRTRMRLFSTKAVDIPLDFAQLELPASFQHENQNLTCNSATANRQLAFNDTQYEVSLCDLVDSSLEFAWDAQSHLIYWRQNRMSTGWLIFLTIVSLMLFTKVCEHTVDLTSGRQASFSHVTSTLPFCCMSWFAVEMIRERSFMLTLKEHNLQIILITYVCVKTAWPVAMRAKHKWNAFFAKQKRAHELEPLVQQVTSTSAQHVAQKVTSNENVAVGVLIVTQLVLTANMQFTYDTPFLFILVFFFGARSFLKFVNLIHIHMLASAQHACIRTVLFAADLFVFVSILDTAVWISAASSHAYIMSASTLCFLSVLTGSLLSFITYTQKTYLAQ